MKEEVTVEKIWLEYEKGVGFKQQINLFDTVKVNEDFFIGKQWEGVNSNGLPTPVFNFIKRVVLFQVASCATDNVTMAVSAMSSGMPMMPGPQEGIGGPLEMGGMGTVAAEGEPERVCEVMNAQFDVLFEDNRVSKLIREFSKDAAVRGDACIYSWFDASAETGQEAKGLIRTEILENTRVIFGNPNVREVENQPFLIISRRERLDDVRREAEDNGEDADSIRAEGDELNDRFDALTDDKVTTLTRFWKDGKEVWWSKSTKDGFVKSPVNSGMYRYPIVWMSWDRVHNCYHGQASVTGLIPNQVFVNKAFAMTMISLMTTAYPKIVYDSTRISRWDSGIGKAIGVKGSIENVAKPMEPAVISPQVSQFIDLAVSMTKENMGATDAALGDEKADNAAAIISLQKASSVPLELVKQDLYQAVEDLGRIWLDQMRVYYGTRYVELPPSEEEKQQAAMLGMPVDDTARPTLFDFGVLERVPLTLQLDVGGSAYWSEISQVTTLENLLANGNITTVEFLERLPNGYLADQDDLIKSVQEREAAAQAAAMPPMEAMGPAVPEGVPVMG